MFDSISLGSSIVAAKHRCVRSYHVRSFFKLNSWQLYHFDGDFPGCENTSRLNWMILLHVPEKI